MYSRGQFMIFQSKLQIRCGEIIEHLLFLNKNTPTPPKKKTSSVFICGV